MGKTARNLGFLKWCKKVEKIVGESLSWRYTWFNMYKQGLSPQQAILRKRSFLGEDVNYE